MLVLYKLSTNRNGTDTLAVSTESMLAHSKCTASSLALAVDNRTCRISHSHRRVYTMNSETANPTALSLVPSLPINGDMKLQQEAKLSLG